MYDNDTRRYLNISAEYEIESHDEFHNRTFQTNLTKNVPTVNSRFGTQTQTRLLHVMINIYV